MSARVLMIDNYDSFTYNVVQALLTLGADVRVLRNDRVQTDDLNDRTHLVVSPGPGNPDEAGRSCAMIEAALGRIPVLGICLGHQCLVQVFGGRIDRAPRLMHGKSSRVHHDRRGVLASLPSPFEAGRYHSLTAVDPLPSGLELTGWTAEGEVMAVRATDRAAVGLQFHPESVLTPRGPEILAAFLEAEADPTDEKRST